MKIKISLLHKFCNCLSDSEISKIHNKYTTQRIMVVLTLIERETLQVFFFKHFSQMLNVSTFGNTADIYAIVHLGPHACQHTTVDQSHGMIRLRRSCRSSGSAATKTVSFTNPQKKKSHEVKSGDRGGHRINASSSFPVRPIHLCGKFRLRYPRTSLR